MGNIQDHVGEQSQPNGGGMRRMLNDGSQSVAELREFMSNLQGKSPQEVLGEVANSSLVQSTIVSAIGFLIVIFGLSVTSHYWKQAFAEDAKPAAAARAAPDQPSPAAADNAGSNQPEAADNNTTAPGDAAPAVTKSGDPTLDNLGIGDAKSADPKSNPLENSLDNLLDGAK